MTLQNLKPILVCGLAAFSITSFTLPYEDKYLQLKGLGLGAGVAVLAIAGKKALDKTNERRQEREWAQQELEEEQRIASTFVQLYERNLGTVHVSALALETGASLAAAEDFLFKVAEEYEGKRMDIGTGVFYVFPHNNSTMVELNKRALDWVAQQTTALQMENKTLRSQLAAAQATPEVPVVTPQPTWGNIKPVAPPDPIDPWSNML